METEQVDDIVATLVRHNNDMVRIIYGLQYMVGICILLLSLIVWRVW